MRRKTADDYCNDIMEAVGLAYGVGGMKPWHDKYGKDCLSQVTTKIIKRAMRKALRAEGDGGRK